MENGNSGFQSDLLNLNFHTSLTLHPLFSTLSRLRTILRAQSLELVIASSYSSLLSVLTGFSLSLPPPPPLSYSSPLPPTPLSFFFPLLLLQQSLEVSDHPNGSTVPLIVNYAADELELSQQRLAWLL